MRVGCRLVNNMIYNNKNRIEWVDIAKGIGILLVIFCHLTNLEKQQLSNIFVFSFHMPLFFFLSGFVFSNKRNFKSFFIRKLKSIYIPYAFFLSIDFLLGYIRNSNINVKDFCFSFLMHLIGYDFNSNRYFFNVVLWFLIVLFFAEIIFYFISKLHSPIIFIISICCMVLINFIRIELPFAISRVIAAVIFISLGYLARKIYKNLRENIIFNNKLLYILISCLSLVLLLLSNIFFRNIVSMSSMTYGNIFLFIGNAILGIIAICFISMLFQKIMLVAYLGRNSLIILCTHYYFCRLFIPYIFKLFNINNLLYNLGTELLLTICVTMISIPIIMFCNKFLYFIFGKNRNN